MYRPYRQEAISCSHVQPHILLFLYHREHDIDRFLATPFLIVLLLLSAISYGLPGISYFFLNLRLNFLQRKVFLMSVCVCVFFPSILDIKFVGRTSRGHTGGRSHRIFNPPSFCGACLDFCREKDSAIPFPSSTVKSNFVY